jgi:lambda family phage portal protein
MARRSGLVERTRERLAALIAPPVPQRRSAYNAAAFNRLTADWVFATTRSVNSELRTDLRTMRNRARDLVRNSPFGARYAQLLAENVVGAYGVALQAKNTTKDGRLFVAANRSIEAAWHDWTRAPNADASRRLCLPELLSLAVSNWSADGEILIRLLRGPRFGTYGFALQVLDPDYLDEQLNQAKSGTQNEIVQGVEIDEFGAPLRYHLWTRHPDDPAQDRQRVVVAAADIIHAFIPVRPGQVRGIPHAASVMTTVKMLDGYVEAELVAARIASAKMGALVDADPANPAAQSPDAGDATIPTEAEPGTFWDFRGMGAKMETFDPEHPTAAFADFTRMMAHLIATGLGISYGTLTGDLSQANYGSMRVGMLAERDHWRRLQQFLVQHVLDPIYREWIKMALLNGMVPGIDRDFTRWQSVSWQPRGFAWIDPVKDVEGDLLEVAAGTKTLTEMAATRGRDLEEVIEERKLELQMLAEAGVTSTLATKGTVAPAPTETPEPPDDDPAPRSRKGRRL